MIGLGGGHHGSLWEGGPGPGSWVGRLAVDVSEKRGGEVGVARERTLSKGTPFPGLHSYCLRQVVVCEEALFYSKLAETSELWESFLTHPLLMTLRMSWRLPHGTPPLRAVVIGVQRRPVVHTLPPHHSLAYEGLPLRERPVDR